MTDRALIPSREGAYDQYMRRLVKVLMDDPSRYNVTTEQVEAMEERLQAWDADYQAAEAARDVARAATTRKDASRADLTDLARTLIRMIQANPDVTDEARRDAGLPVRKSGRTPAPVPKTMPLGQVISTDRLEHVVSFVDSSTPNRRAKPAGVAACQIYVHVGDAVPATVADYQLAAVATRSPHKVTFADADGGKTAHYLLRWANTKGETGPWSHALSATIPAV